MSLFGNVEVLDRPCTSKDSEQAAPYDVKSASRIRR